MNEPEKNQTVNAKTEPDAPPPHGPEQAGNPGEAGEPGGPGGPGDGAASDETPSAANPAAAEVAVEEEAADPASEISALNDKLLRALAEGENLRRRAQREREDTAKYAITNFARDILPVADNLRRALDSLPETPTDEDEVISAFVAGVQMTERELQTVLERHGIERIDPMGKKFDHDRHEAMFELPTSDAPSGTVVQVLEVGYVLKDRLLRAAKVAVAKALPEPDPSERIDTKV
jgi:molecular chaperone GrpE